MRKDEMIDGTEQPGRAGAWATAFILTVLLALPALGSSASAAEDPLAGGTTTVVFDHGFTASLQKRGVRMVRIAPTALRGRRASFPVSGGDLDPTTGAGEVDHGGGLKFGTGNRTVPVRAIVLDPAEKCLFAKIAGRRLKFASVAAWSFARSGFGVTMTLDKLELTETAARRLNKKLGFVRRRHRPTRRVFVGHRPIGSAVSETQPLTVTVLAAGSTSLTIDPTTMEKLAKVDVKIQPVTPAMMLASGSNALGFPITGGSVTPTANAGRFESAGGIILSQKLGTGPTYLETEISLSAFGVDIGAGTAQAETVAKSNADESLDVGSFGRGLVADLNLAGATTTTNPTARTVSVQNLTATLQPLSAERLDAFVKIYESYKAKSGGPVSPEHIKAGDPLGTIGLAIQTQ